MAHSWRTEPENFQARARIRRAVDGAPVYPRVVERAPRPGDVFALNKSSIVAMFRYVPLSYLYGLTRIELLARKSPEVGDPYGSYRPDEAIIRLYSTPPDLWTFKDTEVRFHKGLESFGARLEQVDADIKVRWTSIVDLARFLFVRVLAHELGHHFDFQYRHKRKLPQTLRHREQSANGHIFRSQAPSVFYTAHRRGLLRIE